MEGKLCRVEQKAADKTGLFFFAPGLLSFVMPLNLSDCLDQMIASACRLSLPSHVTVDIPPEEEGQKTKTSDLAQMGRCRATDPACHTPWGRRSGRGGSSFVRRLPSESSGGEGAAARCTRNSRRPTPSDPTRLTTPVSPALRFSGCLLSAFSVFWNGRCGFSVGRGAAHITLSPGGVWRHLACCACSFACHAMPFLVPASHSSGFTYHVVEVVQHATPSHVLPLLFSFC